MTTTIDLDPTTPVAQMRWPARRYSGPVVALAAVLALLAGLAVTAVRPHQTASGVPEVRINVGAAPYPAPAAAAWRDAGGIMHPIDVWSGNTVTARATEVIVSVAPVNGQARCDLYINSRVMDLANAGTGMPVAICSWVSTPAP